MRIDRWLGDLCAHINFPLEYNMTDVLCDIQKGNAFPLSAWIFGWAEATWEIELTGSLNFLKNGAIATLTQPFKQGKPCCRTPPQVQSNASSSELAMRVLAASCWILYPGCPGPHLCNGFSTIPALDHQWNQWFRPIQTDSSPSWSQLITADLRNNWPWPWTPSSWPTSCVRVSMGPQIGHGFWIFWSATHGHFSENIYERVRIVGIILLGLKLWPISLPCFSRITLVVDMMSGQLAACEWAFSYFATEDYNFFYIPCFSSFDP